MARALAVDPAHETTQEGLDRLARATGRFQDLARVFEELAAQQSDPELGSQLYTLGGARLTRTTSATSIARSSSTARC